MATWTAPLPAAPSIASPLPTTPSQLAPGMFGAAVIIPAASIPYIQPVAAALFTGAGTIVVPFAPRVPFAAALASTGFLAGLFTTWRESQAPNPGSVGTAAAVVKVGSGGAVVAAVFTAEGSLRRGDATPAAEGTFTVGVVLSAAVTATFSGAGTDSGAENTTAPAFGSGTLSAVAQSTPAMVAPPAGEGTLSTVVVANGSVAMIATFSGTGSESQISTPSALIAAGPSGTGALSVTGGGLGTGTGVGALSAVTGVPAAFNSTGTATATVVFGASFGGTSAALFLVAPQARFFGTGTLSVAVTASVTETAAATGTGALSALASAGFTLALGAEGTLYPTEYIEWTASGSGTGTAAVAVDWSEAEAGAFDAEGTLAVTVLVTGLGTVWSWVFEDLEPPQVTAQNEAYATLFAPNPPGENKV